MKVKEFIELLKDTDENKSIYNYNVGILGFTTTNNKIIEELLELYKFWKDIYFGTKNKEYRIDMITVKTEEHNLKVKALIKNSTNEIVIKPDGSKLWNLESNKLNDMEIMAYSNKNKFYERLMNAIGIMIMLS